MILQIYLSGEMPEELMMQPVAEILILLWEAGRGIPTLQDTKIPLLEGTLFFPIAQEAGIQQLAQTHYLLNHSAMAVLVGSAKM